MPLTAKRSTTFTGSIDLLTEYAYDALNQLEGADRDGGDNDETYD